MSERRNIQEAMPCGHLWKPGENPVDNSLVRGRDSTSFVKDKSFTAREAELDALVTAVQDAVDLLAARIDNIEHRIDTFWSVVDAPLSPTEAIERLRRLKDALR